MSHARADVIERALAVLDRHGLADLTMRRLAAELDVRPSALYHHFPNKQVLLAAVADEILARGRGTSPSGDWESRVRRVCGHLRDAMLAWTDGAEVVATAYAFRLGARAPYDALVEALSGAQLPPRTARAAARTLLLYVFGHASQEQMHLQALSAGALADEVPQRSDFSVGLDLILRGIQGRVESARSFD